MPNEELTVNLSAKGVEFHTYNKLNELKKRGKFPSWKAFLKWFVNNKSLAETLADELMKRLKEMEVEK